MNAARNILARGLRFKPVESAGEAMVQEPAPSFASGILGETQGSKDG